MNNKTLLLTLSFTLGTLFTNAQSLSGFQWGEGMGTPDLSWTCLLYTSDAADEL